MLENNEIIKRDFSKYELSNMIVMDETAVFMGQGFQMTTDQRSALSIYDPLCRERANIKV